jgi:NAD(P)-dependent dehydrogenase (short-subunit alcohol dehydrogenase family)
MRVLLTGATRLIGSAIAASLLRDGHEVVAVARRKGLSRPGLRWVAVDVRRARRPADWSSHLDGVAAVISCTGVLQDGVSDSTLADLCIGIGIAVRRTAWQALWAAVALCLVYAVLGTVLVPRLWMEPLGPIMKIWPILTLHFAAVAILDDR